MTILTNLISNKGGGDSMKRLKFLLSFFVVLGLVSCGSSTKKEASPEEQENKDIKKDFTVRDASSKSRPGWIEDATLWSKEHNYDLSKYAYFSYETEPKVDREAACSLARTHARADIASEITSFIQKSLGESKEGQASIDPNNPETQPLREFMETTLAEKVQAMIHGSSVIKTYWEKRQYSKDTGAKKDYMGYTCAALVRMDAARLKEAI